MLLAASSKKTNSSSLSGAGNSTDDSDLTREVALSLADLDFSVVMLHAVLSSGVLPKSHLFYQQLDQLLRSALHLCFHGPGGEPCEWPALVSFMKTMFFPFWTVLCQSNDWAGKNGLWSSRQNPHS